ncbi:MAG TPA: hypothetical protein VL992_04590 [Tepidisphaeraceae bacterium]|nr:hypothetical protein [Tepidisphaeraceae bacterium]
MIHYAFAFIYGMALLGSFVGWGSVVAWIAGRNGTDASLRAVWGMSFCIAIGGVLNLLGLADQPVLLTMVACGVLLLIIDHFRSTRRMETPRDRFTVILLAAIGVVLLFRYAASVSSEFYNGQDDFQGYFVFPEKMVQTGQLGADPFSERRAISSLGGQYLLDSMLISVVDESHLNLLDRGIGLLVLAGLVWGLARDKGLPMKTAACVLLPIALSRPPQVNVSSLLIACAACVALYRTLELIRNDKGEVWRDGILAGLTAAGALTLKNNIVPAIVLIAVLHSVGRWLADRRGRGQAVAVAVVAAISAVLFILPWMIDHLRYEGTLLYPLLGQGYYGSKYGDFRLPTTGMNLTAVVHILGTALVSLTSVMVVISVIAAALRRELARSECLFCEAALIALIGVAISIGGYGTTRFVFAFSFAAVLVIICHWMSNSSTAALAMLTIGLLVGENWPGLRNDLRPNVIAMLRQVRGESSADHWNPDQYRAVQESVPPGQTILARLDDPFLLDFRRNQVDIIDVPGRASPPPGMPCFAGPLPLADYLLKQNIRYIAYSYSDQAGFSMATMGDRLAEPDTGWIANTARYVFDFQDNLRLLGQMHKHIYDDGSIWVIDLAAGGARDSR